MTNRDKFAESVYSPEQLRSFLAVAQSLSFTQAAASLGIGQPTVSQHIRKLEQAVGRPLLIRDTRSVALTADGETMAGFARTILAAHEQAVSHFTGTGLSGRLRFGVTDDLALTQVPRILRQFRQHYPRINLALIVADNTQLQRRVESGHLDVALIKAKPGERRGRLVRRDQLVWVAADSTVFEHDRPVELIVHQAPSLSRTLGLRALDAADIHYRVTCTVRGFNGAVATIRAGLGIAILARSLIPSDLTELPTSTGLPPLGEIDLILLTHPGSTTASAEALTQAIMSSRDPIKPISH